MRRRRIAIVDDDVAVLDYLRLVLDVPDLEMVGFATDGLEALDVVAATKPEVLVLDLDMPLLSGADVARRVRAVHPRTSIVIHSARVEHADDVPHADAFVPKSMPAQHLLDAIRALPTHASVD